jgi:hypothetical protein
MPTPLTSRNQKAGAGVLPVPAQAKACGYKE